MENQVLPGHEADPRRGRVRLVAVTGASAGSINAVIQRGIVVLGSGPHATPPSTTIRCAIPSVPRFKRRSTGRAALAGMRGRSRNRGVANAPWSSPLASHPSLARSWQTSAPSSTFPCASSTTTLASTTRRMPLRSSLGVSIVPGMTSSVRRSDKPDELDLAARRPSVASRGPPCRGREPRPAALVAGDPGVARASQGGARRFPRQQRRRRRVARQAGGRWLEGRRASTHGGRQPGAVAGALLSRAPLAQSTRAKRSACAT